MENILSVFYRWGNGDWEVKNHKKRGGAGELQEIKIFISMYQLHTPVNKLQYCPLCRSPFLGHQIRSDQISRSVVSDSLRPHESQHARPPCPSPTPGVHWDSRPLSPWCHPAVSSSAVPFSSCPQSLPASESFPMSQLFAWGGQSTGVGHMVTQTSGVLCFFQCHKEKTRTFMSPGSWSCLLLHAPVSPVCTEQYYVCGPCDFRLPNQPAFLQPCVTVLR